MASTASAKGSIVLEVLELTRDGGVLKYGTYLQRARYNVGLNAILDDSLTLCVSTEWGGPRQEVSTYAIGRSHIQGLSQNEQYELAQATRSKTIGPEYLELLRKIAQKAGLLTQEPIVEKIDKRVDLSELPSFCPDEQKEEAERVVSDFISSVTCVMVGDGLYGQTKSITDARDKLIQTIVSLGLQTSDFRVNCQDVAGAPPVWKTIEEASEAAIGASVANDRFWD